MIREDRFLISRNPYAVDLTSFTVEAAFTRPDHTDFHRLTIRAAWFRRRRGVTVACYGRLWDYQDTEPADARAFLENHTDGRYGGDCWLRWDGQRLWDDAVHLTSAEAIRLCDGLLAPMLDNYPQVPVGYDGWWTFRKETGRG